MTNAVFKQETPLKYQVDSDSPVEEVVFEEGEGVLLVQEFPTHFLIKCELGHFYNVGKGLVDLVVRASKSGLSGE